MQVNPLENADILALRSNRFEGVVDVLSGGEVEVLESLDEFNLNPEDREEIKISLNKILFHVRRLIFEDIELPEEFTSCPLKTEFNENFNSIGIIVDGKVDIDQIREWVINTLGAKIEKMLEFGHSKELFLDGGPIAVKIIQQSYVEEIRKSLPQD
ncbi:MAG: hypothetical protein WC806_05690 [Candidatus Gracilibacteria bacterium]|jgi:hypothetical protein